jgi:hypothetical protein
VTSISPIHTRLAGYSSFWIAQRSGFGGSALLKMRYVCPR